MEELFRRFGLDNKEIKALETNDPDVQAELDTILLLEDSYGSDNETKREEDLFAWEQAVGLGTEKQKMMIPDEREEFKIYPETVKQVMRLIYGE